MGETAFHRYYSVAPKSKFWTYKKQTKYSVFHHTATKVANVCVCVCITA
jgi:hypothetical protein